MRWFGSSHRSIVKKLGIFVVRVNSIGTARRQAFYLCRRVVEQNRIH